MNEELKHQFTELYDILKDQNKINKELTDQIRRVADYARMLELRIDALEYRLNARDDYEYEMKER